VSFGAQEEYRVLAGGVELRAEPSGKLRAFGELPSVGDRVMARLVGEFALIEEVLPRRTAFVRKAAGKAYEGQCVAANVDVVFVVVGLDGDFNLRRLERYLILARESGAQPVVALNKADVCPDVDARRQQVQAVADTAPVIAISAQASVEPLWAWLEPGTTAVLLGSSGAGKSTITNTLVGTRTAGALVQTRPVRAQDSRGRHTTTNRMLIKLANGASIIDTPGMRELGLIAGADSVEAGFPEVAEAAAHCRFADCRHGEEPGCAVQQALTAGVIETARWESYGKLAREARYQEIAADRSAQAAEKQRWRAIHKANKRMYRDRGR
jgi:ribosome biogenesis GTPase